MTLLAFIEKQKQKQKYPKILEKDNQEIKQFFYSSMFPLLKESFFLSKQQTFEIKKKPFSSFTEVSQHIPKQIREYIQTTSKYVYEISFSLNKRNVNLVWICPKTINKEILKKHIQKIWMWFYILSPSNYAKEITVYFYWTPFHKILGPSILNESNVNTAFTYSCQVKGEIILYREEEWFKVLIHESFHAFCMDFSNEDVKKSHRCILSLFPVKSKVNLYEAYTEFWAEIWNIMFYSFFCSENPSLEIFIQHCEKYRELETQWGFFQLTKVLKYMHPDLTYRDLISNNSNKSQVLREKYYQENTNVLSYYILKMVLMANFSQFLKWSYLNNGPTFFCFNHSPKNKTQEKLCEFILMHYKKKNSILLCVDFWQEINAKNPLIDNTLRMTCINIE
jgi:hypothetical protein